MGSVRLRVPTPERLYLLLSILQGYGMASTTHAVQSLDYPTKEVLKTSQPAGVTSSDDVSYSATLRGGLGALTLPAAGGRRREARLAMQHRACSMQRPQR